MYFYSKSGEIFHSICGEERIGDFQIRLHQYFPKIENAPGILFIHGLGENWDIWTEVIHPFQHLYNIYSLELPWNAYQGQAWTQLLDAVEWLNRGLNLLNTMPVGIIAHSFGSNILLEYINKYGIGNIQFTILISPFYRSDIKFFDWELLTYYINNFSIFLEKGLSSRKKFQLLSDDILKSMANKVRDRIGPTGWLEFFRTFFSTPHLNLNRINCPVLLIGGERETACPPDTLINLCKRLPNSKFDIIPSCGHFPMLEHPDIVRSLFLKFINDIKDI